MQITNQYMNHEIGPHILIFNPTNEKGLYFDLFD